MPVFHVPDMSCDACVRALSVAVRDVDSGAALQADLESKQVRVASSASAEALAAAMREAGFTVAVGA